VDKDKDFIKRVRKRLAKTLTNSRIIYKVFKGEHTKNLQIPCFINDYNY
jgi:hypothetical protein